MFTQRGRGGSALSGEEYRHRLRRAFVERTLRERVLSLPYGSGAGMAHSGAQPGFVFCVRIADHPMPWFRYVPLDEDLQPRAIAEGTTEIVSEVLACLVHADPGTPDIEPHLDERTHKAAFAAWQIARDDVVAKWNFNADPANIQPVVPLVLRRAADIVRRHGKHRDDQDELVERIEIPYPQHIRRSVGATLAAGGSPRDIVDRLATLADEFSLASSPGPEPLPVIASEDVHLVCWVAIQPTENIQVNDPPADHCPKRPDTAVCSA
jgi:hypothetical protein